MNTLNTIAQNLAAWMAANPNLDTVKKVSARSGVGFGTVRRTRNGEGNPTVTNLAEIAHAFGRSLEDLLRDDSYPAATTNNVTRLRAAEPSQRDILVAELQQAASTMNDRGLIELIGRAKEIALQHPLAKANRRS